MQLNLKNDEAHGLAAALAELTGESLTVAVTSALRDRLSVSAADAEGAKIAARLMAIGARYAAAPV